MWIISECSTNCWSKVGPNTIRICKKFSYFWNNWTWNKHRWCCDTVSVIILQKSGSWLQQVSIGLLNSRGWEIPWSITFMTINIEVIKHTVKWLCYEHLHNAVFCRKKSCLWQGTVQYIGYGLRIKNSFIVCECWFMPNNFTV